MNHAELQHKLLAAARAHPPSDHVPYAFEKRIMARLGRSPAPDSWTLWSHALWRAAAPCLTLTLCLTLWSLLAAPLPSTEDGFESALDDTLLSAVETTELTW